jgi:hypothetical protein
MTREDATKLAAERNAAPGVSERWFPRERADGDWELVTITAAFAAPPPTGTGQPEKTGLRPDGQEGLLPGGLPPYLAGG